MKDKSEKEKQNRLVRNPKDVIDNLFLLISLPPSLPPHHFVPLLAYAHPEILQR